MGALSRIQHWCEEASHAKASDVFLNEGAVPRYRLDGRVRVFPDAEPTTREQLEALRDACAGSNGPPSGDLDAHWQTQTGRYRVNVHRHLGSLGASLRIIQTEIPLLESLGLPVPLLESWSRRPHGFILVTGPTGCGKSTTVASMLDRMNTWFEGHVITIEEPIEYLFRSKTSLVTQREIPEDIPSYAAGLRSALRQSPDVIFMGEIRDFDSARIAVQAAETGHLVISTMHTSTVVETMERLANLMPADERRGVLALLASQLVGVLTQKLVAREGGGRHLITEYFQNEGATRDWIQEMDYAALEDFIQSDKSAFAQDFLTDLTKAWREQKISRETALASCPNPKEMERVLRGLS